MADERMEKELDQDGNIDITDEIVEDIAEDAAEDTVEENKSNVSDAEEAGGQEASDSEEEAGTEDAAEEQEAKEGSTETQGGRKDFFGKKKEKKDKKDTQIEELTDRLMRQMAEFDNFRKRTEKEKAGMYEIGAKSVIEKMLPVVDNFERGLGQVAEDKKDDPFVTGMEKIYKQLMTALEELEVKPIEAVGQEFDPNIHNAVMHVEDEEVGENIVVEEFQKGYTYREGVVRHSMVKVAN